MSSARSVPPPEAGSSPSGARPISSVTSRSGLAGTPRLSQIPPRGSYSGSFQPPRSLGSERGVDRTSTPPPRSDADIGGKAAITSTSQTKSALTAALGKAADSKDKEPEPPSPKPASPEQPSGSATPLRPDESAFSTLAEVPDEEKARVLRRHLVSAEERGSSRVPTPGQDGTPVEGSQAGDSAVADRPEDEPFPIPYDAPGGDVTCVRGGRRSCLS